SSATCGRTTSSTMEPSTQTCLRTRAPEEYHMTSIHVRQAVGLAEARSLDTDGMRRNFLIEDLFAPGAIRLTYSHYDRTIIGGAVPTDRPLPLATSKAVGSEPFLKRREMGVFNIGGKGWISLDGEVHELGAND